MTASGCAANSDFDPHAFTNTCADCGDLYSNLVRPPEGVKFGSLFADEDEGGDFAVICLPCLKLRRASKR